jgi:hypothetical protein
MRKRVEPTHLRSLVVPIVSLLFVHAHAEEA